MIRKNHVFIFLALLTLTYGSSGYCQVSRSTFKKSYDMTFEENEFNKAFSQMIDCQKTLKKTKASIKQYKSCVGKKFLSTVTTTEVDLYANWLLKGYQFQELIDCEKKSLILFPPSKGQVIKCSSTVHKGKEGLTYIVFQRTAAGLKIKRIKHLSLLSF